jgi:hypothetical protein
MGTTSVPNPAASGQVASDGHEHHHSHGHGGGEPGPGQQVAPGTGVRHHDHHREGEHRGHEGKA